MQQQTIQREARKSHFVPHTASGAATYVRGQSESERAIASIYTNDVVRREQGRSVKKRTSRNTVLRIASTIFWAVMGEKAFGRAISQDRIPAALVGGSLAAGTAYVQDRSARRAHLLSHHAVSKRSVLSLYAVIGLGLGLGAALLNRLGK